MLSYQSRARSNSGAVLVVDDDDSVRTLIRIFLTDRGYHVLEAHDAEEAFDSAARHVGHIDLLITDVVMPGMRGPELAEHLQVSYQGLKVLFISGFGYDAKASEPNPRVASFLKKPFSLKDMARRVEALLGEEPVRV